MAKTKKSPGEHVYEGNLRTVPEARSEYLRNRSAGLISYVEALNSARRFATYARELFSLRGEILDFADQYAWRSGHENVNELTRARTADIVSTALEWISRHPDLPNRQRECFQGAAMHMIAIGIHIVSPLEGDGNCFAKYIADVATWCHLHVTRQRLQPKHFGPDLNQLNVIALIAPTIKDSDQRASVYSMLGSVYRQSWRGLPTGYYWSLAACFMPGLSDAARLKSIASLLGCID